MLEEHRLKKLAEAQTAGFAGDRAACPVLPTGLPQLDRKLPGGGVRPGSVMDCLCDTPGAGAVELALRMAIRFGRHARDSDPAAEKTVFDKRRWIVVIDPAAEFYPPAAVHLGLDLNHTIVLRPPNLGDAFWSADQCLRCRSVAAVCAVLKTVDEVHSRRLQLAAEAGGSIGILLTPARRRPKSFAAVQMLIQPAGGNDRAWQNETSQESPAPTGPFACFAYQRATDRPVLWSDSRRVRVSLIRVREGMPAGPFEVELPDAADLVSAHALSADRPAPAIVRHAVG